MSSATLAKPNTAPVTGEILRNSLPGQPIKAVIVTSELLNDGIALDIEGCDLTKYNRSGSLPILDAHQPLQVPIGRLVNLETHLTGRVRWCECGHARGQMLPDHLSGEFRFDKSRTGKEREASVRNGVITDVSADFDVVKSTRNYATGRVGRWVLRAVSVVGVGMDPAATFYQRGWRPAPAPTPATTQASTKEEPMRRHARRALWGARNLSPEPDPTPALPPGLALERWARESFGPFATGSTPVLDEVQTYTRGYEVSGDAVPEPLPAVWSPFSLPLATQPTRPERRTAADREMLARAGELAYRYRRERDAAQWRQRKTAMAIEEFTEVALSRARVNAAIRSLAPRPMNDNGIPVVFVPNFGASAGM